MEDLPGESLTSGDGRSGATARGLVGPVPQCDSPLVRGLRPFGALALLLALAIGPGAAGASTQKVASYPILKQLHFTGTPIGIFELDGGASVGPVVVLGEFNVAHFVPNSFVGIVSSSFNVLGQASANGSLVELGSQPRPGGTQGKPDLAQIAVTLQAGLAGLPAVAVGATTSFPEAGLAVMTGMITSTGSDFAATFPVQRPGDLNVFQLYFNPALTGAEHTHELQFVIGNDRQVHLQPPLTPNLAAFAKDLAPTLKAEDAARKAVARKPSGASNALKPVNALLTKLTRELNAAVSAGEASVSEASKPKANLAAALRDSKQIVAAAKLPAKLKLLADSRKQVQAAGAAVAKLIPLRLQGS
jgi:hypothetical protein